MCNSELLEWVWLNVVVGVALVIMFIKAASNRNCSCLHTYMQCFLVMSNPLTINRELEEIAPALGRKGREGINRLLHTFPSFYKNSVVYCDCTS